MQQYQSCKGQDNRGTLRISDITSLRSSTFSLSTSKFNEQQTKKLNNILKSNVFLPSKDIVPAKAVVPSDDVHSKLLTIYSERQASKKESHVESHLESHLESHVEWGQGNGFASRLESADYKLAGMTRTMHALLVKLAGSKYLDLGCGDGSMGLIFAKKYNLTPTFMDIGNYLDQSIRDEVNFAIFDPAKDIVSDTKYEIISCFHIIHHIDTLANIKARLSNIHELLVPDGLLICREHNITDQTTYSFVSYLHIVYEVNELDIPVDKYQEYLNNYRLSLTSIDELASIALSCGFKVVCSSRPYGNDNSYYIIFQRV